jgi:hypothetical protein
MTFDDIKHLTRDDAGCAVWLHYCCNGHPAMRHDGKTQLVRRLLWSSIHGPIPGGRIVRCKCGTPKCVNPECLELTTRKKLAKELGAIGLMSGQKRSAAIARAKRKTHGKLTQEAVDAIRSSSEKTDVLGARYGISAAHVSKVRIGKSWRDFSSPWAGL